MPKIITNLQNTRANRRNCTNNKNPSNEKTTSELLSGLRAEHIPLPDTQCIKRVLENSRRARSKKNDPPRPPNAFFLFRNALHSHLAARNLKVPQVSMAAGELWAAASEEIKSQYTKLQEIAKVLHLEMHPGYVYRPRKLFPPNHDSPSSVNQSNLEKDKNPSERTSNTSSSSSSNNTTTSSSSSLDTSLSSISESSSPAKFITSRLAQVSITQHNGAEKLQIRLPSLTNPNPSLIHYNNNICGTENIPSRDFFASQHNNQNQRLMKSNQVFTNNITLQTPEIPSQQQQSVPVRLVRYFSPVQNHNQQNVRYHDINNHDNYFVRNQYHHQFTPLQQQNQIDPVLITTLTSITALPAATSVDTVDTSNNFTITIEDQSTPTQNNIINNGLDISVTSQPTYHYRGFSFGDQRSEPFNDWINWDHL